MAMRNYRDLIVWQKGMDLVAAVYQATQSFPTEERFGLTSQMRRAAVSIPSNIAEGQGRDSAREFKHFLSISYGSLCELQTQLLLSERLSFLDHQSTQSVFDRTDEVARPLNGLSNSLTEKL